MESNWKHVKLGDVCTSISDTIKKNDFENVVLINTSDVLQGKVLNHNLEANKNLKGQFKKKFKQNDILYSEIRPKNGRFAFIDFDPTGYIASTKLMVIRCNENIVVPNFLFGILKSSAVIDELQSLAETRSGTFPQITFSELSNINIQLPSVNEQQQIAKILSSIDDKIELNNKINDNLEQQAQAIFKSWFVDFEPFGGVMPSDWVKTTIGTMCNCVLGGTPSRKEADYWNGDIPWINSGSVNLFRIVEPNEKITQLGLSKSATKLMPAKTTVLAITGATLGQVSLLEIDACANQSVVGIYENDILPYEYILPFVQINILNITSHQTGGAQQHINKQNIESIEIDLPTPIIIKRYKDISSFLYSKISNNCFENKNLTQLRDTLLPKLMNGEIDVS